MAVVAVLVVIAGGYFIVLRQPSGTQNVGSGISASTIQTPVLTTAVIITTIPTPTTAPTPPPDPFPNALTIRTWFNFSSGKTASQGTVYKKWINDTYQWHDDMDNKWYTQKAKAGNKFLFVFVCIVDRGDTRVWYPKASSIVIHFDNQIYSVDQLHYIPDKSGGNLKATAIEVGEVQYYHKLFGAEYTEDYGLSHGTMSDYVYPGESNAIDGYIIYEVPAFLTAEDTYVEISFNGQERAVWKLE